MTPLVSQPCLPLQPAPVQPQTAQWEWGAHAAWEDTAPGVWKVRDPRDPERSLYCGPSERDAADIAAWALERFGHHPRHGQGPVTA